MALIRFLMLLLVLQGTAHAFPKPVDVPAYVDVPPVYEPTSGGSNATTDPSVTPPTSVELPDIPSTVTSLKLVTGSFGNSTGFCLTTANGGTCQQAKFRTTINTSHILYDDPVRNFGQLGQSHCHQFFGNKGANGNSTYKSLRTARLGSTAAGLDLNATAYWFPCFVKTNPFGDGKNYVVKANWITVYYTADPVRIQSAARLYRGLRYVGGCNMDVTSPVCGLQTRITDAMNTANTAIGNTRYRATNPLTPYDYPGQIRYVCSGSTVPAGPAQFGSNGVKWLKNADGTDPFGGTCASGADFWIEFSGPDCWDGTNLWSPGGYSHVIPKINDSFNISIGCPKNYYMIPSLELEIHFSQQGFSDYGNWRLSSDDTMATACGCTVLNGYTFHTDWMNGWDGNTLQTWLFNCLGVEHHTPHECNGGIISSTQQLNTDQIVLHNYTTDSASNMFLLPSSPHGPGNMDMTPTH